MKHRKFVKQLMSLGLDRNGAEMCAAHSRRIREPYADGLARFQRCLREIEAGAIIGSDESGTPDNFNIATVKLAAHNLKTADPEPVPVTVMTGASFVDWRGFDWPPQPQPVAGCLYAIDTAAFEPTNCEWPKENPHTIDALDALRYAVEAIHNRQREVLGR